jgi:hypothetical protein
MDPCAGCKAPGNVNWGKLPKSVCIHCVRARACGFIQRLENSM